MEEAKKEPKPRFFKISETDLVAVINYLAERPYKEVSQGLEILRRLPLIEEDVILDPHQ